jgi:gliding motility-associated-like protein
MATLTATGATTYSWSPATGLSVTTGSSVDASPTATTTYTITGTSLGCDGIATSTVTVGAIPIIAVTSTAVCIGASTTLTATGSSAYSWTPSTGLSATTGSSVIASPLTTTTYTITETSSGCNGNTVCTVTVNPLPTVTASNTGPYCQTQPIQISCVTTAATMNWQGPNSFIGSGAGGTISNAAAVNAGTYTVTVTDVNSCQAVGTTSVIVNPLPVVTVNSNSPVCENNTLNLSASSGASWSWSGPSFTSTSQTPSLPSATLSMSGSYTVVVTDANGCVNANVTNVTITPRPSAPAGSNVSYCQNASADVLTAVPSTGGTLNWYGTIPSGGYSSSAPIPATAVVGSTPYYVSQTVAGCEGAQTSITVTIKQLPVATLNVIPPQCVPLCDTFSLSSASTLTAVIWNMGNGFTTNGNNPIYCYGESGNYSISVDITDSAGCRNSQLFSNCVHVNEIPVADFSYSPDPVSILEPNVTFYNTSVGGIASSEWNFYRNDTLIYMSTAAEPAYVFPDINVYNVQLAVISNQGCKDTIVKPIEIRDEMAVYIPNAFSPDNDNINDEFKVYGVGIAKVKMWIFDRWGEKIFWTDEMEKGWNGRKNDVPVKSDIYIYKVEIVDLKGAKTMHNGHVTVVR